MRFEAVEPFYGFRIDNSEIRVNNNLISRSSTPATAWETSFLGLSVRPYRRRERHMHHIDCPNLIETKYVTRTGTAV